MSLALETSSAKDAAEFLRERDFEVRLTEWPRKLKRMYHEKHLSNILPFPYLIHLQEIRKLLSFGYGLLNIPLADQKDWQSGGNRA